MPSFHPIAALVENDVKFHDDSMDFFLKNTIEMNLDFQSHWMALEFHDILMAFTGDAFSSLKSCEIPSKCHDISIEFWRLFQPKKMSKDDVKCHDIPMTSHRILLSGLSLFFFLLFMKIQDVVLFLFLNFPPNSTCHGRLKPSLAIPCPNKI